MKPTMRLRYFLFTSIPMFFISLLTCTAYSIRVDDYLTIDWLAVLGLTMVLALFFTWWYTRKQKEG
jgi:hypothetical protein